MDLELLARRVERSAEFENPNSKRFGELSGLFLRNIAGEFEEKCY